MSERSVVVRERDSLYCCRGIHCSNIAHHVLSGGCCSLPAAGRKSHPESEKQYLRDKIFEKSELNQDSDNEDDEIDAYAFVG